MLAALGLYERFAIAASKNANTCSRQPTMPNMTSSASTRCHSIAKTAGAS